MPGPPKGGSWKERVQGERGANAATDGRTNDERGSCSTLERWQQRRVVHNGVARSGGCESLQRPEHTTAPATGDRLNRSSPHCDLPGWRVCREATNGRPAEKQSWGRVRTLVVDGCAWPSGGTAETAKAHQPCTGGRLGHVRALRVRPRSIYLIC